MNNLSAAVVAVLFLVGYAWANLVKLSTITRMYSHPPLDRSRCRKSIDMSSIGIAEVIGFSGAFAGTAGLRLIIQRHTVITYVWISVRGQ